MATYWLDPFLEATTQGNGTTDTSTQDGSYAAPFSFLNFRVTSSSGTITTINGTTLSDGDEVRFKGLPFATLFESKGNVYHNGGAYNDTDGHLQPVTGNSSFDATISATKSSLFAIENSVISSYLPGWSHPLWFTAKYTSDSSNLYSAISPFLWAVVDLQLGHNSASDTGIEIFRLKDTYANPINMGSTSYYWFSMANKVKLTAGWTSTTAQDGYSIFEPYHTASYKYLAINYSDNSKTQYDLERCVTCHTSKDSSGRYNEVKFYGFQSEARGEATDHVFFSHTSSNDRGFILYPDQYPGSNTTFPYIGGDYGNARYAHSRFQSQGTTGANIVTCKNLITQAKIQWSSLQSNMNFKIGNVYATSSDDNDNKNRLIYFANTDTGATVTYLQDSVYFLTRDGTYDGPILLQSDPAQLIDDVYESGLKKPGIAPLNNLTADTTSVSAQYGPDNAGALIDSGYLGSTREVSANNLWFTPTLSREGSLPIRYGSLEKLICNSNNYKTTIHNILTSTETALGATDAPKYMIWSAEHNDYDGKPVSIIGDPYTAGKTYGVLLYNDTVNSQSVLVGQWSGTTGGASTQAWIPLDLAVPSYSAGSDNLRVTVSAAYADGASNSAAGSILLRAWHREATQANNFRVYSSSATAISAGGNAASPTTVTLNLSNVATSGQEEITSVIVGIRLDFTSNTNIQKYYVTNAAIETY
jgi:hypothetical protein